MKTKTEFKQLPGLFKPLFWSYNFGSIDPERDRRRVIINTINYGQWEHWLWVIRAYGKDEVKRIIQETPRTEFREQALRLVSILLGIRQLKYASRSDYIKSRKNLRQS